MNKNDRYDSLIRFYAEKWGLDWKDCKAQLLQESRLDPKAVSKVGAEGLAQAMPGTWADYRKAISEQADPFNPESSIDFLGWYMASLLKQFVELEYALAAYNWGRGNLHRVLTLYGAKWRDHLPQETEDYLERIAKYRQQLEATTNG